MSLLSRDDRISELGLAVVPGRSLISSLIDGSVWVAGFMIEDGYRERLLDGY